MGHREDRRWAVGRQPSCLGRDHRGDAGHDRCCHQPKPPPVAGGVRWGAAAGVGVLEGVDATRAEGGAEGGAMLSSARRRSARTSAKEGNGRWRVTS